MPEEDASAIMIEGLFLMEGCVTVPYAFVVAPLACLWFNMMADAIDRIVQRASSVLAAKGFKNASGRDCICVNGSFFDFGSGFPVGSYVDCRGRNIGGSNSGLLAVETGHESLHGFPPSEAPKHATQSPTGRTGACTGPGGGLLFLAVVNESNGAGLGSFSACMKSICKSPNKVVILDGNGSSQIWHNGKPIYSGDNRTVVNWLVICK